MQETNKKQISKTKSFYISCLVGLFALIGLFGVQNQKETPEYAQIPPEEKIAKQQTTVEEKMPEPEHNFAAIEEEHGKPVDFAEVTQPIETAEPVAITEETPQKEEVPHSDSSITAAPVKPEEPQEETVSVLNTEDQNQGLTWPISGTIVLNYSMDKSIYFPTLGQYKCNPALMIAGTKGDTVVSASDCKVIDISTSKETGLTITAQNGDFTYIYGQLEDTLIAKGDTIKEGQSIATLNTPTDYFTQEGCHLYFQILEDGESVNPLLLLK